MRIRTISLALAAAAASAAAPLAVAAPANAAASCYSNGGVCYKYLQGTPWSSPGDNIRPNPNTYSSPVGFLPYGEYIDVLCYTTGQTISGNSYWDRVSSSVYGYGYIADAVLNTGGTITNQVPHC